MNRKQIPLFQFLVALCFFLGFPYILLSVNAFTGTDFLYKDKPEALHVREYFVPQTAEDVKGLPPEFRKYNDLPKFLSSSDNGDRVVVFYAPWCGHCTHLAPLYMDLATKTYATNPDIQFYAVSCTAFKDVCHQMDVHGYPTVHMFRSGSATREKISLAAIFNGESTVEKEFAKTPEEREEYAENVEHLTGRKKKGKNSENDVLSPLGLTQDTVFSDVTNSFFYNLRNEIFMSLSGLDSLQTDAFSDWLNMLSKALPMQWKTHEVLSDLIENLEDVASEESHLLKVVNKYDNNESKWSALCTSKRETAGYTCGLWQLFHVATIGIVEQNWNLPVDQRLSPAHAASSIRNFVAEFFGCSECKDHFLELYDTCWNDWCKLLTNDASESSTQKWREVSIWIWNVHNNVNVRLMHEDAARKGIDVTEVDEMKAEWPSRVECIECWNADRSYNADEVYMHLRKTYWPRSVPKTVISMEKAPLEIAKKKKSAYMLSNIALACVSLWLLTMWYVLRERHLERTGRHKKFDYDRVPLISNV